MKKFLHTLPETKAIMGRPGEWFVVVEGKKIDIRVEREEAEIIALWLRGAWPSLQRLGVCR